MDDNSAHNNNNNKRHINIKSNPQLSHDFEILHRLLKRNYAQHHRALYFKRLQMAISFISKHQIVITSNETSKENSILLSHVENLQKEIQQQQNFTQKSSRSPRRFTEAKWELPNILSKASRSACDKNSKIDFLEEIRALSFCLTSLLPEALNRIEYAASALFETASNGYFLPFCTVALSALARVRTILMMVGKSVAIWFQENVRQGFIYDAISKPDYFKETLDLWGGVQACKACFQECEKVNIDVVLQRFIPTNEKDVEPNQISEEIPMELNFSLHEDDKMIVSENINDSAPTHLDISDVGSCIKDSVAIISSNNLNVEKAELNKYCFEKRKKKSAGKSVDQTNVKVRKSKKEKKKKKKKIERDVIDDIFS